jgi:hypothetical protein
VEGSSEKAAVNLEVQAVAGQPIGVSSFVEPTSTPHALERARDSSIKAADVYEGFDP